VARLDFGDQMRVRLFNDTRLEAMRAEIAPGIPLGVRMFLAEGGLSGQLTAQDGRVTINTPTDVSITVLATDFFVVYDPARRLTVVGNFRGTVLVEYLEQSILLDSGFYVAIEPDQPPGVQFPMDSSLVAFEARARVLRSPIAAADELAGCENGFGVVRQEISPQVREFQPGDLFRMTWEIHNTGSCPWTGEYRLAFAGGERMTPRDQLGILEPVAPGDTFFLSLDLEAPSLPGNYSGRWQMVSPEGQGFGEPLVVDIVVARPATVTPTRTVTPTNIPTPSPTPTSTPTPAIPMATFVVNANCRRGPSQVYGVRTSYYAGTTVVIEGRNSGSTWWWILMPNRQAHCWVSDVTVSVSGPVGSLPIIPAPPTPTPVFTPTMTSSWSITATPTP
jgi:hypothetical protein